MAELTITSSNSQEIKIQADYKDFEKNVDNLIFAYLFLTHKMKFHGLNSYEYDVIVQINIRLEKIGVTKNLFLNRISEINNHLHSNKKQEYGYLFLLAKRVCEQRLQDYILIMSSLTNSNSYRVIISINKKSTRYNTTDTATTAENIKNDLKDLLHDILNGRERQNILSDDSLIHYEIFKVPAWDINSYHETLQLPPLNIKTQKQDNLDCLEQNIISGLGAIVQYVEIYPGHIPINLILAILLLINYVKKQADEMAKENKENESDKELSVVDLKDDKKQNQILDLLQETREYVLGDKKTDSDIKDSTPRIDTQILDQLKKMESKITFNHQNTQSDKSKPSSNKEGLIGILEIDVGGFLILSHSPSF